VSDVVLSRTRRLQLEQVVVEARWRVYRDCPATFFRDCVQVPTPQTVSGRGPFDLYGYQQEALDLFDAERFVVGLKARQLGWTTLVMAYCLHQLLFRPGANILLVSKDQPTANKALTMLDFMWDFLPAWVRGRAPKLDVDAVTEHVWLHPDGMRARIVSRPATKTVGAGETATLVVWDEAALAKEQDDTYRTLKPTTDAGGKMIVFSTARGAHNRFAQLFRDAQQGRSQFVPLFHPWMVSRLINPLASVGGVDTVHYDQKRAEFADEPWRFYAEYPSNADEAFRQSGRSRFEGLPPIDEFEAFGWRGRLQEHAEAGWMLVADDTGPLRLDPELVPLRSAPQWARPVLAVDPASGIGGDYTAMTLGWLDETGVPVRVGFWHANDVEPHEAAAQADVLGRMFKGRLRAAQLVVEKAGGYDLSIVSELRRLRYPNLYLHRYQGHRRRKLEETFGFPMTATRRPLVIDVLASWLNFADGSEVMRGIDPLLRYELGAFVVTHSGKFEADTGCHDDLVMSAAIWLYVLQERGVAPTAGKGEQEQREVASFDLSDMFADIETARRAAEAADSKFASRMERQMRRSRR
jgi:hypothetical protein